MKPQTHFSVDELIEIAHAMKAGMDALPVASPAWERLWRARSKFIARFSIVEVDIVVRPELKVVDGVTEKKTPNPGAPM